MGSVVEDLKVRCFTCQVGCVKASVWPEKTFHEFLKKWLEKVSLGCYRLLHVPFFSRECGFWGKHLYLALPCGTQRDFYGVSFTFVLSFVRQSEE